MSWLCSVTVQENPHDHSNFMGRKLTDQFSGLASYWGNGKTHFLIPTSVKPDQATLQAVEQRMEALPFPVTKKTLPSGDTTFSIDTTCKKETAPPPLGVCQPCQPSCSPPRRESFRKLPGLCR